MVSNRVNDPAFWDIRISSKKTLTQANRDFIVELVSEEARKATSGYSFVLHDVIESAKYCRLRIEASKPALAELRRTLKDNLPHRISTTKLNYPKDAHHPN